MLTDRDKILTQNNEGGGKMKVTQFHGHFDRTMDEDLDKMNAVAN